MTNLELSKYLKHYVEMDKTKSAIMLTGEWGTGKSHYIKNELIPFLKEQGNHDCILISLYGLSCVNDISKSIYLEARINVLKPKTEIGNAGTLIATTIIKGVSSHLGIELGASDSAWQQLYQSINLSGKLIILEDIERTQINLMELMGYVNNLVEQDGVKVLLVANEEEILQYEPETANHDTNESLNIFDEKPKKKDKVYTLETLEYLKTKEKTIIDTIVYCGDYIAAIKQIIDSFGDEKLHYFANDNHAKEIFQIMGDRKNYNLRSFIYACQKTVDIYQALEGTYNDDFLTCIFYGIIHFSMRIKAGMKMVWTGTDIFSLELGSAKYPLFRFCYDYMQHHVVKRDKIPVAEKTLENLRLYDKSKTADDPDLITIGNFYCVSETKLRLAVESVQKRLVDPSDISFYDYGPLAVHLLYIKHYYGIDISVAKSFLVENLRGRGEEIDTSLLFRIGLHSKETALQDEYNDLRNQMEKALEGDKFLPNFNYTPGEAIAFRQQFENSKDHFETGKLAALLDIPRMVEMFLTCAPDQMDEIRYAFGSTYRSVNIGQFLSADRDALIQLRDGIKAGINTHQLDCVQKLQCNWFAGNLQDIIDKLH